MLFILGLAVCAVIGFGVCFKLDCEGFGGLCGFIGVVSTFIFLCSIVTIPVKRMEYHNYVAEYQAIKTTIAVIRKEEKTVELTAVILELVKINAEIASARYWDGLWFGVYIPDEYVELEYLK